MAEVMKYDDFKEEGSETAAKVSPRCLMLEDSSSWRRPGAEMEESGCHLF